jgi:hypothetical protein
MKNDFFKTFRHLSNFWVAHAVRSAVFGIVFLSAVPPSAIASPELDRAYALSSIGILRAWDNVDGLFGDMVTKAFTEHLANESRFTVQDLSKANAALTSSKMPYAKVIEDPSILGQLAKTFKLDSFLRTKAYKEGPNYKFTIDWIHAQKLQVIATETVEIEEPFRGQGKLGTEEFRKSLTDALDRMIAKVPFKGSVTGRDQTAVTVNLGASSGIKKGDTVVLATLDDVKYHPLLKTVVDWRLTPTGKATVDEVDEGIAFAKIDTEEYGRQIQRFQKVVQIIPAVEKVPLERHSTDLESMDKKAHEPPRIGFVAPGLLLGSTSRDTLTTNGSGFLIGVKGEAQVWLTSDFFADLKLDYGSASYSQTNNTTGVKASGVNISMSQFRLAGGYFYHVTPNFFGPKGWVKLGYQSTSYGLPLDATAGTGHTSYSGLFLGIGGDLPVREDYGVILDVDFGIFGGGSDDGSAASPSGSSSVSFFVGGYAWVAPKLKFQVGLDFKSNSLDFVSGNSLSNKTYSLSPSVLFYF